MPMPSTVPQTHKFPLSPFAAAPVNCVPLPGNPVLVVELKVDAPNPPIVAIIPPIEALVVVLPRNTLKASVVHPPITTDEPPLSRETTVPETVIGRPPASSVCEPDATTYTGVLFPSKAVIGFVLPPTFTDEPPDSKEYVVPETVIGAPPAESVWEPIT